MNFDEAELAPALMTERKTIELCRNKHETGLECVRKQGHEGLHESLFWKTDSAATWE